MNRRDLNLAAALLTLCAARHYGWALVDPEIAGIVSKMLGSIAAIGLLAIIWMQSRPVGLIAFIVGSWYAFEELQTVVCSALYLIEPWAIKPGQAMCSAKVGVDIGLVGIIAISAFCVLIARNNNHDNTE